jgi:WD40 repeat protein
MLGTVSFDGSLRIWDLKSLKLVKGFEDRMAKGLDGVIQCLTWPSVKNEGYLPSSEMIDNMTNLVVVGTSGGTLKLIDLKKNKVIWIEALGSLIFDLDWSEKGILAVALCSRSLVLRHFNNGAFTQLVSVQMDSYIRCLQFCPANQNLLAAGLFSGDVVIYDLVQKKIVKRIKEARSRILCVQWHPSSEDHIAFGSFDAKLRVHSFNDNQTTTLVAHTGRLRALHWNTELPNIIVSGGDDNLIVVWNLTAKKLLI